LPFAPPSPRPPLRTGCCCTWGGPLCLGEVPLFSISFSHLGARRCFLFPPYSFPVLGLSLHPQRQISAAGHVLCPFSCPLFHFPSLERCPPPLPFPISPTPGWAFSHAPRTSLSGSGTHRHPTSSFLCHAPLFVQLLRKTLFSFRSGTNLVRLVFH